MEKSAFKQQQDFAQLYGTQGSITWDFYNANDKEVLEDKIKYLFPKNPKEIKSAFQVYEQVQKENEKLEFVQKAIIEAIWNQRKFCEGNILMSIIFVLHTPTIVKPYSSVKNTINYTYNPLFRVKKCQKNNSSDNCCSIFVDSLGRVYQNWRDYVLNNKLPSGIIITPKTGVYRFDCSDTVILEYLPTPSSSTGEKILQIADYSAVVLGLGTAALLPVAAFAAPLAAVAAPITLGCTFIGSLAGSWSIGRSSANLADRGRHQQSIGLGDRDARSSWINIAAGSVGIGASGLARSAAAYSAVGKTVPRGVQQAVIGVNSLAVVTNGVGIGNNIVDIIMKCQDNQKITSMDVMEISASLVLFTHSIYNLHLATKMIKSSNNNSGSLRYLFEEKVSNIKNILLQAGKVAGNMKLDIILPLKKIPNNKCSGNFLDIIKQINNNSVLPHNIHQYISKNVSTTSSNIDIGRACLVIDLMNTVKKSFFVGNEFSLTDALLNISDKVCENVLLELVRMAKDYVLEVTIPLQKKFHMIPFESFLWELFKVAETLCGQYRKITINFLKSECQNILKALKKLYYSRISNSDKEQKCEVCGGHFRITSNI